VRADDIERADLRAAALALLVVAGSSLLLLAQADRLRGGTSLR
jgi:hypothetical protein